MRRFAFLGEHPGEFHQLYTFNIHSRIFKKLTNERTNLIWYSMTPSGDRIAYTAEQPVGSIFEGNSRQHGLTIAPQPSYPLFAAPRAERGVIRNSFHLATQQAHEATDDSRSTPACCSPEISLSPDGKYIAMAVQSGQVPQIGRSTPIHLYIPLQQWRVIPGGYSNFKHTS